jgi:hypothetical protein
MNAQAIIAASTIEKMMRKRRIMGVVVIPIRGGADSNRSD